MIKRWPPSPYIALAFGICAVSAASILIRYAQAGGTSSLVIAALRLTFASLILTPIALRNHSDEIRALSRSDVILGVVSGVLLAIHFATWITSLEYVSVLVSVALVTTSPLWVALFSVILLKEGLSGRTIAGICVAVVGGLIISFTDTGGAIGANSRPLWGSFLAAIGALTVALYLIIGRRLRAAVSLVTYIWMVYSTAAVVLLLSVFVSGQSLTGHSVDTYFWILMLALFPQLMGHTSYNYALAHMSATLVSLTTLTEPVGSAILAFLLLGEIPEPIQYWGAALVIIAIAFAQQQE